MDEQPFCLKDEDRNIEFRGRLLASASSEEPGKTRWTEVEIYKTVGGNYVVSTIGRSREPAEHDFHRTNVSETARGAVEVLYQIDRDGVRYLTWTARQALDDASDVDEELREAYQVQAVD
jgi:hypothetical protein